MNDPVPQLPPVNLEQASSVKKRIVLLIATVILLIAGGVYAYTQLKTSSDTPLETPQPTPLGDVMWVAPALLSDANYFPKYPDYELKEQHYKVGTFTGGPFQDAELVLVMRAADGMGGNSLFRFAKTAEKLTLLQLNSDEYWLDPQAPVPTFAVDKTYSVQELSPPKILKSPDGKFTLKQGSVGFWGTPTWKTYDSTDVYQLFADAVYGRVYIRKDIVTPTPTPGADVPFVPSDNGYYLRLADDTVVVYGPVFEFMDDTYPSFTWTDGYPANGMEYTWQDFGGCGSYTIQSIVPPFVVNPNTDLMQIAATHTGEAIYGLKNSNHTLLKEMYDNQYSPRLADGSMGTKMSYAEFLGMRPMFFWKDQLDHLVKFQNKYFVPPGECGKPVIYLYPEETTRVSVHVRPRGGMTVSEPAYGSGWIVTAQPDGKLTNQDGTVWPYLFWEGKGGLYQQPTQGWSVARADVPSFLDTTLAKLGLNTQESADFKEFWVPRMQDAPHYFISFMGNQVMDALAPLSVHPRPDTIVRILMDFLPLSAPIAVEPPSIRTPIRSGFTVIEWGGVIR